MPRRAPHTQIRRAGDMKPGDVFHTMLTATPGEIVSETGRWWRSLGAHDVMENGVPAVLTTEDGAFVPLVFHSHALLRQDVID